MSKYSYVLLMVAMILGRVMPHGDNITPTLALILMAQWMSPTKINVLYLLIGYACADILIASGEYSIWGSWSFYTYSGLLAISYLPGVLKKLKLLPLSVLVSSVGFWMWTNLGVWIHSGLYDRSIEGLITCYTQAIPFLQHAVLGDVFWTAIVILVYGMFYRFNASISLIGSIWMQRLNSKILS